MRESLLAPGTAGNPSRACSSNFETAAKRITHSAAIASAEPNGDLIQLDAELSRRIQAIAKSRGESTGEVVRRAVDRLECESSTSASSEAPPVVEGESMYDRLVRAGLIGCIDDDTLPTDLSTNKKYMEGFGLSQDGTH